MGLDINSNFTEVENCGSCGKNSLLIIHDFGNSPLAGYFPHKGKVSYDYLIPMQLLYCKTCFLTQISPNVSDDLLFKNYRYVSAIGMKQHFANFANWFQKFLKIDTDCSDKLNRFATSSANPIPEPKQTISISLHSRANKLSRTKPPTT